MGCLRVRGTAKAIDIGKSLVPMLWGLGVWGS